MPTISVLGSTLLGIEAKLVKVEVDVSNGLPSFNIVGLPGQSVKEARERVRSALKNSGFSFPRKRIVVNLAPASLKKEGSMLDLPVAAAIIFLSERQDVELSNYIFAGELSLEGDVKGVTGMVSVGFLAREEGKILVVPEENSHEADIVDGLHYISLRHISELPSVIDGDVKIGEVDLSDVRRKRYYSFDWSDVKGQASVKRALEVAASGMHNVIMVGPPGTGKSMLAKAVASILPDMSSEEVIEVTRIYSAAGMLDEGIVVTRPFRSPHHTISDVAMCGGGVKLTPGEVTLAHCGVLFLDEMPEFKRNVLEALRQPMEDGVITVSRSSGTVTYPARFMLIGSMNPCPYGDFDRCSSLDIKRYFLRISAPLLDRIDIQLFVNRVPLGDIGDTNVENSEDVKKRVERVHQIQAERFKKERGVRFNSQMGEQEIRKFCRMKPEAERLLEEAFDRMNLSMRSYSRIIRVARTIADMRASEDIDIRDVAEALDYKKVDRTIWKI